jgi:hypothetical protein
MRIVYQRCCGMDVHKDSVTACVPLIIATSEMLNKRRFMHQVFSVRGADGR